MKNLLLPYNWRNLGVNRLYQIQFVVWYFYIEPIRIRVLEKEP
jgi:hypothetical protein